MELRLKALVEFLTIPLVEEVDQVLHLGLVVAPCPRILGGLRMVAQPVALLVVPLAAA